MPTSRPRSRLRGFGLVDSLMGLFILLVAVGALFAGYTSLTSATARQVEAARQLAVDADGESHAAWY